MSHVTRVPPMPTRKVDEDVLAQIAQDVTDATYSTEAQVRALYLELVKGLSTDVAMLHTTTAVVRCAMDIGSGGELRNALNKLFLAEHGGHITCIVVYDDADDERCSVDWQRICRVFCCVGWLSRQAAARFVVTAKLKTGRCG